MLYRPELFVNYPAIKATIVSPWRVICHIVDWFGREAWNYASASRRVKRVVNINAAAATESAIAAVNVAL
jgi:hypothetical protein